MKLTILFIGAAAFPTLLTCPRTVEVGSVIMNAVAEFNANRAPLFMRNGVEIACGSTYTPGETLTANLDDTSNVRYSMELENGDFTAGCDDDLCDGARCVINSANNNVGGTLTAPMTGDMILHVGWASAFGVVSITEDCVLYAPNLGMRADPHVHTSDGHIVDIYLPLDTWSELIYGPTYTIVGHVFGRRGDEIQWFDGIALVANGTTVFNASIPHDVALGEVGPEIQYLTVDLDGNRLTKTNNTYVSGDVEVTTAKLDSAIRQGKNPINNDIISVATPDFDFKVYIARETRRENYDSLEEQLAETHLDFKFTKVAHPERLSGPVAEIMWSQFHSLSDQAIALMKPEAH